MAAVQMRPDPSRSGNRALDDQVEAWHEGAGAAFGVPLHAYLGMTWEQYCGWTAGQLIADGQP